jgi:mRNA interferase MazF
MRTTGSVASCYRRVLQPGLTADLVCPITRQRKGYPFEVGIPAGLGVEGVALCDHARGVDWRPRNLEFITPLPEEVTAVILATVRRLLD